jgi:hypothetical protein
MKYLSIRNGFLALALFGTVAFFVVLVGGCQQVGPELTQDENIITDKGYGPVKANIVDNKKTLGATGSNIAGSTLINDGGIQRTNAGAADSLMFYDAPKGKLGLSSNADLEIRDSIFYSSIPDKNGQLQPIAKIGTLTRNNSTATKASNEALDRMKDIFANLSAAQLEALKSQAAAAKDITGEIVKAAIEAFVPAAKGSVLPSVPTSAPAPSTPPASP